MAVAQPLEHLDRDQVVEVHARQVLDVVVLGDHVAVVLAEVLAIDEAVDLEHHRPPVRVKLDVGPRVADRLKPTIRSPEAEPALVRTLGGIHEQIEVLPRRKVRRLHQIVIVRRHHQRRAAAGAEPAQPARNGGEKVVHGRGRELLVEHLVQDVVQRARAAPHRIHVLGDVQQVRRPIRRILEQLRQMRRQLPSARGTTPDPVPARIGAAHVHARPQHRRHAPTQDAGRDTLEVKIQLRPVLVAGCPFHQVRETDLTVCRS